MNPKEFTVALAVGTPPVFRSKHAALLTIKSRVLATGVNQYKTHPMMARYCKHPEAVSLHAEIDCLTKALRRYGTELVRHSSLYVARVTKDGSLANSQPCVGCQRAIDAFQVKTVYYTTKEGWNE